MSDNVKLAIRGLLAEFYNLTNRAVECRERIAILEADFDHAKAIRYNKEVTSGGGGLTNDARLAEMITETSRLETEAVNLELSAELLGDFLKINDLSERDRKVLDAVFKFGTYELAGREVGYTPVQIYRIMTSIYDGMRPCARDFGKLMAMDAKTYHGEKH